VIRSIAVLGVGAMGGPIADNLDRAGFAVRRWDLDPERSTAATAADAAAGADAVLSLAPDGPANAAAVEAARPAPGTIWLQCATVGERATDELAALAAQLELVFVDAPLLGTTPHAIAGRLHVLPSGPVEAREPCDAVFAAIGERWSWLGEAGAGSRMKLVFNAWLHTLIAAVAESVAFAEALGLDPEQFFEVVDGTPADVPVLRSHGGHMLAGSFEPGLALEHARKDAALIVAAAREAGVEPLLTEAVLALTERTLALGHEGKSFEAVYLAIRP
jgi:3-hydroxyisobutyrate dehydrogenase